MGPGVPAFLTDAENCYQATAPNPGSASTGRRLALSRWLTQPGERPARSGSGASEPDLATSLRNRPGCHFREPRVHGICADASRAARIPGNRAGSVGLECQALHRLILCSSVYRQGSTRNPEAKRVDPENRMLSEFPVRHWMPRRSGTPCCVHPESSIAGSAGRMCRPIARHGRCCGGRKHRGCDPPFGVPPAEANSD